jgi:UDP-N-acetylmuramate dehydrogenase
MKIGGKAQYFFESHSADDVAAVIRWARDENMPLTILGGGSNVLISDHGVKGMVVRMSHRAIEVKNNVIRADAGVAIGRVAMMAARRGLAGLEFALGLPGTIGGAVYGNAGAFGGDMKQCVQEIRGMTRRGELMQKNTEQCGFGYRTSVFQKTDDIILNVTMSLRVGTKEDIQNQQRSNAAYRKNHQPLDMPSCGSVFRNVPYASVDAACVQRYHLEQFELSGMIPAGYIIDRLELKGYTIGGAQISEKHANFIINLGAATADHVIMLMGVIQQKVRTAFRGLRLEPEVRLIGFEHSAIMDT